MIILNDRFEIDETRPLPHLDQPLAKAYAAGIKGGGAMFVLVSPSLLPLRTDFASAQRSLVHPGILHPQTAGVVDWPQTGDRHAAIVYDLPAGERLAPHENASFNALREESAVERVARPLGGALAEMARNGIFHGGLRVSNIYMSETAATLGDNLAAPASFGQPVVYETIDRGLAPQEGRGLGYAGDDLYALGVVLLAVMMGERPLKGISDKAILQLKMERGSYGALVVERRFSSGMVELLRGLLSDDPKQRWNSQDLDMWMQGRRLTPRQSTAGRKAARILSFAGQEFTQVRQLMAALTRDTGLAAALIRSHEMARWIGHGFNDEKLLAYLEEAAANARHQKAGPEDERLVTNTIIVLDPLGPIRYRGISVFPAGLPLLLADMALKDQHAGAIAEIILNDFANIWLAAQPEKRPELLASVQAVDKARERIANPGLGFGMERALYDMNPTLPCLSPFLRSRFVVSVRQLLEAIDRRALTGAGSALMDRHIAAFILARDRATSPQMLKLCDSGDPTQKNLALLTLYSELQHRHGPEALKGVAGMLQVLAETTVRRFKSRARREKIVAELKAAAASGQLGAMLRLVDDPGTLALDAEEFSAAQLLYQVAEAEIERLDVTSKGRKTLAREAGEPLAAALSVGGAFIILVVLVLQLFG